MRVLFILLLMTASAFAADVVQVIDGDTVKSGGITYRAVGYDTPEVFASQHPCPAEFNLGKTAGNVLRSIANEIDIIRVPCANGRPIDKYGRTCARLEFRGQDVAAILIEQGLAVPYDGKSRRIDWCARPGG